jgi:chemotaxis family two-component system response regulator Rcp1
MRHILLAEDNKGDVMLVREALTAHHIENTLYVVKDGQEALDFVARMGEADSAPCPDLMLLDMNLPKVDGVAVLAAFREHKTCVATPVIIVSSSNNPGDRNRVAALGVSHYFRKPPDFDEFMKLGEVVRDVLENETANHQPGIVK